MIALSESGMRCLERAVRDSVDLALSGALSAESAPRLRGAAAAAAAAATTSARPRTAVSLAKQQRYVAAFHPSAAESTGPATRDGIFSRRDRHSGLEIEWTPPLEARFRACLKDAFERLA